MDQLDAAAFGLKLQKTMMPGTKLGCPHCGHDGTKGTTKSPHEPYGFNYLSDDVVCRDVQGYDESGRLRISDDFQCEGSHGVNPRIECRSCWQTFPIPEGLSWITSEPPAWTPEEMGATGRRREAGGKAAGKAADKLTRGLTALVREALEELEEARAAQLGSFQAKLSADVAGLREEFAAQRAMEAQQGSLSDRVGSLDGLIQALQGRLATQADAIRRLHATVEEQTKRREDLLAAARKLQEIAGVTGPSEPLPEGL